MNLQKRAFLAKLETQRMKEEILGDPPEALETKAIEEESQVLVKPQPKSLGRIGGFEI